MIFILAPAEFRFRLQFPLTLLQIVIDFVSLALQSFNIFNCEIKLYQDFTCLDLHRTGLDLLTFKHLWTGDFICVKYKANGPDDLIKRVLEQRNKKE